jgi:hypothetical protein
LERMPKENTRPAGFGPGSTLLLSRLLERNRDGREPAVGIAPEYCREPGLCDIPT